MPDSDTPSVISRIIAAHRGRGTGKSDLIPALQSGLTRAIRRAALPYGTLTPSVAEVSVTPDATLSESVPGLPEHGLLAAIEDEDGRRGLFALDHPLVDSLIEVQATGHVEEAEQPPRAITRIDEALCRDFVELVLGAFALETARQPDRDWPDRMSYGSSITDRAQLNLLMPERGYHLLQVPVTMGGHKTGTLAVLLPSDPAIARKHASAAPQDAAAEDWSERMLDVLGAAPMALDAVLLRVVMPLGKVEALVEGDLIPFEHADLGAVSLEDEGGHVFARGGLGQLSGRRAVRLGGAKAASAPEPPPADNASSDPLSAPPPTAALAPVAAPEATAPMAMAAMSEIATNPAGLGVGEGGYDPNASLSGLGATTSVGSFDPNAPVS
ncbi:FliM/FliN family flagellar motor switch protein [Gymnodinialimonas ceratoperidinii]|uniref:FliM/FliN family flagellar motor switch protein n=1 Tax=Gymnodinialimonas ceratoperidinii TaxID=2856823 RepID=A0A8F6TUH8_9RHOB|nr:FliM/FliN family flagellar motor switch protein [Gymnodinialimonas ceratoperidinii]QXT38088.1 FliM/FliN family flagellar motor switch protein [Gymnodinialimonas ceratoperidinii]